MILIFAIFAYPLGWFLDWLLGKHNAKRFPKKDLKALIELHKVAKQNPKKNETDVPDSEKPEKHGHGLVNFNEIFFVIVFFLFSLINQVSLKRRLR